MSTEFFPSSEAETNEKGEIAFDAGKVLHLENITLDNSKLKLNDIKRTEISDFGNEGFLLKNVLTRDECHSIIEIGEHIGFGKIVGATEQYRSAQRIALDTKKLADILWERIKSHVEDLEFGDDPHLQHIHGIQFQLRGTWKPVGLNHIFRLCRYLPKGHFAPHFDGFYVKNSTERSMKTFMLYLNEGFSDGSTNFVDEQQQLYQDAEGKYCAEEKNIRERIQPETGMAILFNHHRLHEGSQVRNGVKYILRTDIMYVKCGENQYSPEEEEALKLLQEAERLEGCGECMKAAKLYRKAFKLAPALEQVT